MLVFVLILLLFSLVFPLAFLLLSFGVVWLLPLSLVLCLLMKVDLNLSAQLGACARTHAPASARLKKNRRKPVLFLSPVLCPQAYRPLTVSLSALLSPSHLLLSVDFSGSHCPYRLSCRQFSHAACREEVIPRQDFEKTLDFPPLAVLSWT